MPTGGETVIRQLEESGIHLTYGIPAVHNLPIYDALYNSKRTRNILVRHEQGAGFMAIGSAYAIGEPAACIVGCGPGATNVVTPVAEAHLDSIPLLVIAGGIRTAVRGKGALHDVDQLSIFKSVTKSSRRLTEPDELANDVTTAISECRSGRPGPVFLEIPFDVLTSGAKGRGRAREAATKKKVDLKSLSVTSRILERAERPVIIIGGGVNTSRSWGEVTKLANILEIPVASTISAKGAFPEDSSLSIGQLWDRVARQAVEKADVVLAMGCRFSERSTANWRLRINGSLIHVDVDPAELGRNYPAAMVIPSDVKDFLFALLKGTGRPEQRAVRRRWVQSLAEARAARDAELERDDPSSGSSIRPQRIIREVGQAIPDGTLVVAETGHAFWWSVQILKVRRPRSFLAPSGNSTLGFGLPAAMGAKCAKSDRPVVCLTGDSGFLLTCQELLTAVEERMPVVVVIIDDGGYSAIREYQRKGYGGRFIGVDFAMKPDYVALAQSMGANGIQVERPDKIQPAIREALSRSRPSLIDIPISRGENALPNFFTETYKRD